MIIHDLPVAGAKLIELHKIGDERGFFARAWDRGELAAAGVATDLVQANLSRTARKGTIRGFHYQRPPAAEDKLTRCIRGAVWEVVLDLRPSSPTYHRWHGVELTADNHLALHIPRGCARGFQTLTDDAEVFYFVSAPYTPDLEAGVRFDDPTFAVEWPLEVTGLSDKDRAWQDYQDDPSLERL